MASIPFAVDIDLLGNQVLNVVLQNLVAHPSAKKKGFIYFNTADKTPYVLSTALASGDGADLWIDIGKGTTNLSLGTITGTAVTILSSTGTSVTMSVATVVNAGLMSAVDFARFSTLVAALGTDIDTGTDILKFVTSKALRDSGVINATVASEFTGMTDKTTADDTDVFIIEDGAASGVKKKLTFARIRVVITALITTHKTAAGDHLAAVITNVAAGTIVATTIQAAINELDTKKIGRAEVDASAYGFVLNENNLVSNSATKVPSQASVKAYVDSAITTADIAHLVGPIDCSTNPNFPAANKGDCYKVSVAGKIGGASGTQVRVGAVITCWTDATVTGTLASVGSNWTIEESDLDNATETIPGFAQIATQTQTNAGTDDTTIVTPLKLAVNIATYSFAKRVVYAAFGDGVAISFAITHGIGRKQVSTKVYYVATDQEVFCKITNTNTTTVTIDFNVAPASASLYAVVIG